MSLPQLFIKVILWLLLPVVGIVIAIAWQWATEASLFKGKYGDELALASAAAFIVAAIIGLQRYIIWAERQRLKRLLKTSIRRSAVDQPND